MTNPQIISLLQSKTDEIKDFLQSVVDTGAFDYRTFGTAIEDHVCDKVKSLIELNTPYTDVDFMRAPDKNYFPELTLLRKPQLALEVKAGNKYKKNNGGWVETNNSGNDLGTLNVYKEKLSEYGGGEDIYFIFVEYKFNATEKLIHKVKIDAFYKFIGLNTGKVLKYREKDGNLRPKNFDDASPITSLSQFVNLIDDTLNYRAKRIITKQLLYIPLIERDKFLDGLKTKPAGSKVPLAPPSKPS